MKNQITDTILMVRPQNFGFNELTASSNAFQVNDTSISTKEISAKAVAEFDGFVEKLRANGIRIIVAQDSDQPVKSDAVFPNNWVSFHENGTVILYPMFAKNRRLERSEAVLNRVFETHQSTKRIDLSVFEARNIYLEGTGSLILDRPNNIAYACVSPRTEPEAMDLFCKSLDCKEVLFEAVDEQGQLIYHTNVMMGLGVDFVVICMESIKNEAERALLESTFERTGKTIIDLSFAQINAFAGNMLQVKNEAGKRFLVMSEQAFLSLTAAQVKQIEQFTNILHAPIYTIEKYGGGSARCMMAEVFLPKK